MMPMSHISYSLKRILQSLDLRHTRAAKEILWYRVLCKAALQLISHFPGLSEQKKRKVLVGIGSLVLLLRNKVVKLLLQFRKNPAYRLEVQIY